MKYKVLLTLLAIMMCLPYILIVLAGILIGTSDNP